MNNLGTSYLFWFSWFFGLAGLHRFYNKKYITGFLWLFTFGLCGLGQFVDFFTMGNMVEEHNLKERVKWGLSPYGVPIAQADAIALVAPPTPTHEQLMVKLLNAAATRGGQISVTQGVMDTGATFSEVEASLKEMLKSGYVVINNHPTTGVVIYEFIELSA